MFQTGLRAVFLAFLGLQGAPDGVGGGHIGEFTKNVTVVPGTTVTSEADEDF